VFQTVLIQSTGSSNVALEHARLGLAQRTYPHIYDSTHPEGAALVHLLQAKEHARLALDAFDATEFSEVQSRMSQIAVNVSRASELCDFNPSLATACVFIRRALLSTTADSLEQGALNALYGALAELCDNPMLTLSNVASVVDQLESDGWSAEHPIVKELTKLWIESEASIEKLASEEAE
jgi:hypothetical protein